MWIQLAFASTFLMDPGVAMLPELGEGDSDDIVHDPGTDARGLERAMLLYRRDSEAQLDAQQRQITELTNANAVARQKLDALLAATMATKRSKHTERYEDTGADRERTSTSTGSRWSSIADRCTSRSACKLHD